MDCSTCSVREDGRQCFDCKNGKLPMSSEKLKFIENFNETAAAAHHVAVDKKWWETPPDPGAFIANLHGEVSEAWEAYRKGNPKSDKIPGFSAVEEELADAVIRIMDYAAGYDLKVAEAIIAKIAYNATRPDRHGGKLW